MRLITTKIIVFFIFSCVSFFAHSADVTFKARSVVPSQDGGWSPLTSDADDRVKSTSWFIDAWYFNTGIIASSLQPQYLSNGWESDEAISTGFSFALGYHFLPDWSIELAYTDAGLAQLENADPVLTGQIPDATINYQLPSLMLNYYLGHENNNWRPYLRAGITQATFEPVAPQLPVPVSEEYEPLVGIGSIWRLNETGFFKLQIDNFQDKSTLLSLQFGIYFGGKSDKQRVIVVNVPEVAADDEMETETSPLPESAFDTRIVETVPDSDGDGVDDPFDRCPQTPRREIVDSNGCAIFSGLLQGIQFKSDSAELTEKAETVLNGIADILDKYLTLKIKINAHTDNQGRRSYNQALSENRAKAVRQYLIELGIEPERMQAEGFGESQPIASNDDEKGRQTNRRVEFEAIN